MKYFGFLSLTAVLTLILIGPPLAAVARAGCVGDCNNTGTVVVIDILIMLDIALGNGEILSQCPSADANGDGKVTVDEILTAENNLLNGCVPGN